MHEAEAQGHSGHERGHVMVQVRKVDHEGHIPSILPPVERKRRFDVPAHRLVQGRDGTPCNRASYAGTGRGSVRERAGSRGAGRLLGINPHTLRARMRKLGIDWGRFREPAMP